MRDALTQLRWVSMAEGLSWLVLLFVAMPLKYLGDDPSWVWWTGRIHGALFVLLGLVALRCWHVRRWPFRRLVFAGVCALLPFGAFVLERSLAREARAPVA
jgi:integral membrane protein